MTEAEAVARQAAYAALRAVVRQATVAAYLAQKAKQEAET